MKTECVMENSNIMVARVFSRNTPQKAKTLRCVSDRKGD